MRHFSNTWFVTHPPPPPRIWNVFDRPESLRTNNSIESWNASWNKKIRRTKANIWLPIRFLKGEEVLINALLGQIERGERPPAQRKKWLELNKNIAVLKQELTSGERNLENIGFILEAFVQMIFDQTRNITWSPK